MEAQGLIELMRAYIAGEQWEEGKYERKGDKRLCTE